MKFLFFPLPLIIDPESGFSPVRIDAFAARNVTRAEILDQARVLEENSDGEAEQEPWAEMEILPQG